jgi:hypothetical protein
VGAVDVHTAGLLVRRTLNRELDRFITGGLAAA